MGRIIFEEFSTLGISLTEQMWVTDPEWQVFLNHLRFGQVKWEDIEMLRQLVLTREEEVLIDFSSEDWKDAALVTLAWHAVHCLWKETALLKHGKKVHHMILECKAEETIKGEPLIVAEKFAVYQHQINLNSTQWKQDLPGSFQMTIGMKVMVTQNIITNLDIMNGAWGTIADVHMVTPWWTSHLWLATQSRTKVLLTSCTQDSLIFNYLVHNLWHL